MKTRNLVLILAVLIIALWGVNTLQSARPSADQYAASAQGAARGNAVGNSPRVQTMTMPTPNASESLVAVRAPVLPEEAEFAQAIASERVDIATTDTPAPEKRKFWVLSDEEVAVVVKRGRLR